MNAKKQSSVLFVSFRIGLALASVATFIFLAEVLQFILATGVGSEEDLNDAMRGGGMVLTAMSAIVLAWIVYGLRGVARIVCALSFAVVMCVGLLSVWEAGS